MLVDGKDERLNIRPGGEVTSPVSGSTYNAPATIEINADAVDYDGSVMLVEFLANGEKLGEDAASPYEFMWNDVPAGSYQIAVRVMDNEGAVNTSYHSTVIVE